MSLSLSVEVEMEKENQRGDENRGSRARRGGFRSSLPAARPSSPVASGPGRGDRSEDGLRPLCNRKEKGNGRKEKRARGGAVVFDPVAGGLVERRRWPAIAVFE